MMKKFLSTFLVIGSVAGVTPVWGQASGAGDMVREYQVVSSRQMAAGQGATASQITSTLTQDVTQTTTPEGNVQLEVTPTSATVGVSGAGTSDVPLDDAPATAVSAGDVAAAAPPNAVTVLDNEDADDGTTSLRVESDLPAPAGSGVSGGPVTVNTNSTTAMRNGEPVAAVTTYASEPISFTTAAGDTVVMRTEGFSATDPATGQPIASGSRAIGQTVTAAGDLVPFAMQSSSAAGSGNGSGDSGAVGSDAAGLGAVAGLLADYSTPLSGAPASGEGAAPPSWLGAVAGVASGVEALASSASAPGTSPGTSSNLGGSAAAALSQANSAAADALVGPAVVAAGGSYDGLGGDGNGAGDGSGSASALAAASQSAFGGVDAGNGQGGSGVTVSSGPGASVAATTGGSGFGVASGGDPIAMALGSGGSADTAAFGGAAIYGSGPGGGAGLPDLGSQVVVSDQGVVRNAVANLAVAGDSLFSLPASTGGFTSISVPNQLLTFSIYDNGGVDNEDVVNITFTNNGTPTAVSPSGNNVTLFFLTNGQGTTFNASTNPAVASNQFSVSVTPGTAQLNFEAVSSAVGNNGGAVQITSPVLSGPSSQVFDLPQAGGDFATLNIQVTP